MTPRTERRHTASGFTIIEVMVAIAVAVLLATLIAPIGFSWIDEGRAARAQNDAGAISLAMSRFFQDTTKWPGQVEILESGSDIRFLTVGDPDTMEFPSIAGPSVGIGAATCAGGLSGVVAGQTAFTAATPNADNSLDVLDFLIRPPSAADYPNWRGPYLPIDLTSDPWERVYVINVIPLFCAETIVASDPGGALGFGWVLSAGTNRTLQTAFDGTRPAEGADDVGVTMGKRVTPGGS